MPRLVSVQRPEDIQAKAQEYVKSYILFPSGLVGLICLIGGAGGLGYQLLATDSYTWNTFYQSSALIVAGIVLGMVHTRYHQFLYRQYPDVLAARMKKLSAKPGGKSIKEPPARRIVHPGRPLVPLAYAFGVGVLLAGALAATLYGEVNVVPALLMPWAGFYWARLFFWRKVVG